LLEEICSAPIISIEELRAANAIQQVSSQTKKTKSAKSPKQSSMIDH
jgi:hypothetical protein